MTLEFYWTQRAGARSEQCAKGDSVSDFHRAQGILLVPIGESCKHVSQAPKKFAGTLLQLMNLVLIVKGGCLNDVREPHADGDEVRYTVLKSEAGQPMVKESQQQ